MSGAAPANGRPASALTEARRARIRDLRAQGWTFDRIAEKLGIASSYASELVRDKRSNARLRPVRATTISIVRQPKPERVHLRLINPDVEHWRPTTRAECDDVPRPCPYVGCQHNLYLDVSDRSGFNVKLNFPDLEPGEMPAGGSCALDLAERGGLTLEETGDAMNVTRERIRQLEAKAVYSRRASASTVLRARPR